VAGLDDEAHVLIDRRGLVGPAAAGQQAEHDRRRHRTTKGDVHERPRKLRYRNSVVAKTPGRATVASLARPLLPLP
jgi:hypothetical protein